MNARPPITMGTRRAFLRRCLLGAAALAAAWPPPRALLAATGGGEAAAEEDGGGGDDDVLGLLGDVADVMRRDGWRGAAPRTELMRPAPGYYRLTVHHTAGEREAVLDIAGVARQIEGIAAGHMERHYGDIAYHLLIDPQGRVWEGRSLAYEGAHVLNANEGNVGVALLGNFSEANPSDAQMESLDAVSRVLCHVYDIPSERVYGHRDLASSACPGEKLYERLPLLRDSLPA